MWALHARGISGKIIRARQLFESAGSTVNAALGDRESMREDLVNEAERRRAAEELSREHSNRIHHLNTIVEEHQQMLASLRGEFKSAATSLEDMKKAYEALAEEKKGKRIDRSS